MIQSSSCPQWQLDRPGPAGDHDGLAVVTPLTGTRSVLELRCPVTVPREIGSLSRMNDDGTNIIVSQQRRDLVFGDWTSAAIFVPRRSLDRRQAPAPPAPMLFLCGSC